MQFSLTRPEDLNLIIHYFNLTAESINFAENPEITRVKITEFYLRAPQVTTTTCNATPTGQPPRDSSPPGRESMDDDLGAIETLGDFIIEREYHT